MTNDESVKSKTKTTYVGKIGWFFVSLQIISILAIIASFKFPPDSTFPDFMWIKTELDLIRQNVRCGLIPTFRIIKLLDYFLGLNILCPIACFMGWLERKKSENKNAIIFTSIVCALITVVLSLILATYYQPGLLFEMKYSGQ
jgi:hypothetical protein